MEFGFALTTNLEQEKNDIIHQIGDNMKIFFAKKTYGADVKAYTIGIVCVAPEFVQFFKAKKAWYVKGKKTIMQDGMPFTLEDNLEYSININFEDFKNATVIDAKKILAKEVIASLLLLEPLKKKIKDFDFDRFKLDVEKYFHNEGLLSFG